jgi:photosystem II stability/assembly factor-like uncharacterized protein
MKNICVIILILFVTSASAQKNRPAEKTTAAYDTSLFNAMHWRNIGPWRGGRSLAVCGVADQPDVYYFGAVGGGIWKTQDGGQNWSCISDTAFHSSSVGAITVAPSDPNIIYAGMGESEMRGNVSFGDGIYKSTNAGRTWKHIGLEKSDAISTILVHPSNPDIVYATCMGKVFATNPERGLYRSKNGGESWERILYKNDSTGCISAVFDPSNPKIIYAALWQSCRNPWSLNDGGKGSSLYKSEDGGDSWENISEAPGMPVGLLGKIHITISPAMPERIYASIENENGGIFRSDDRGAHWIRTTDDRNLRKRPWYFSTILADPQDANTVWCLNVQLWKSTDAGIKFVQMPSMHGDHHDIWINPKDHNKLIMGDDGGGYVSKDGGRNYTSLDFPTAQFYHVNLDNDFPYNVYGAQQDNSSIRIASGTDNNSIGTADWYPVAGGEAGYIVPDPENSDITYGGEYDGQLSVYNKKNNQYRMISVYPEQNPGHGSGDRKYRFNWTFPICFSPFDNKILYVTSQFVHRTRDGGMSWEIISKDLTRHDPSTMAASGGPITKDNTGAEAYANIFAFAESYVTKGVLWAGSDDGLIHVSKDDGKTWSNVTPPAIPGNYALISIIEPSYKDAASCYVAVNTYKAGDNSPYLFKTSDYGNSWQLITNGIPSGEYTRCIRMDPSHYEILYAGTENGVYVSFNDGVSWQSLKLNLPVTPVHDLRIQKRENDLVIATHGRSFWILDDLTPLYQLTEAKNSSAFLYKPRAAYRKPGSTYYSPTMQEGENAFYQPMFRYYFNSRADKEVLLKIFDNKGDTVITYSSQKDKAGEPLKIPKEFFQDTLVKRPGILPVQRGMNAFSWDLRYPDAKKIETGNKALISGNLAGPVALPGNYTARLYLKDSLIATQAFTVLKDPRVNATSEDLQKQFDLHSKITAKLSEVNEGINRIRRLTKDVSDRQALIKDTLLPVSVELKKIVKPLTDSLMKIEEHLTQPKAVTDYDLFNYPDRLDDKLAGLAYTISTADGAPTMQSYVVMADLSAQCDALLNRLTAIISNQLPPYQKLISTDPVFLPGK